MSKELFPIYKANKDNTSRYYLGTKGKNTLLFCGINPSTASKEKSDLTITKISRLANNYGYDSFLMINLYPFRSTYPDDLPKSIDKTIHKDNIRAIEAVIERLENVDLLLCWGNNIEIRGYLLNCLTEIWETTKSKINSSYKLGELTKLGHPRHPSRISYSVQLTKFNMEDYFDGFVSG